MSIRQPWEIEWQDYYAILQVSVNAEVEVIEGARRRLVAKYHPDNRMTGDAERIKAINIAYDILSDAGRRQSYDATYRRKTASGSNKEHEERAKQAEAEREIESRRRAASEAKAREEEHRRLQLEEELERLRQQTVAATEQTPAPQPEEPAGTPSLGSVLTQVALGAFKLWLEHRESKAQQPQEVDISGTWRDQTATAYAIQRDSTGFLIRGVNPMGMVILEGKGTISGRTLNAEWQLADGTWGRTTAEVSANGREISGTSTNQVTGMAAPVYLFR